METNESEKSESSEKSKNIVLLVGVPAPSAVKRLANFRDKHAGKNEQTYRIALLAPAKPKNAREEELFSYFDIVIIANTDEPKSIVKNLRPYYDELLAVTCRSEEKIPQFQKLIPFIPYLRTPTTESLSWATDKIEMRRRLLAYDKSIAPSFAVIEEFNKQTLADVEKHVGYPAVVKPSGLSLSRLVSINYYKEEVEKTLKKVFRKVGGISKRRGNKEDKPKVLVEQQMEGELYSIDAYVNSRGKVSCCPLVHIKTGRSIGFDDFFGYQQMTPTKVKKENEEAAQAAAEKAIWALGLRSITAHVELIRTEEGWKIVEVGPRIGGLRDIIYELSYGIDHTGNDILTRIPKPVSVPRKTQGHTSAFKFFAHKEGKITAIKGIKKVQKLESFYHITVQKQVGDRAAFAKNGGQAIFIVYLFNTDRSKLLADGRRLEQMVKIETE